MGARFFVCQKSRKRDPYFLGRYLGGITLTAGNNFQIGPATEEPEEETETATETPAEEAPVEENTEETE